MPPDTNEPQPQPTPQPTTFETIFRNAIIQNQAIQQRSLMDIQRHTEDVHERLRSITQQHVEQFQLPNFSLVRTAAGLDRAFWDDTVMRATILLQQRGYLPTPPPEPSDATENPPAT